MSGTARIQVRDFDPAGLFAGMILPDRLRKRQSETRFKQDWRLTWAQYHAMMSEAYDLRWKRWTSRARQRGSIIMATGASAAIGGAVRLNGHSINDFAISPTDAGAGINFISNGLLRGIRDDDGDQDFNGEWWTLEPETGIGSGFEARHLSAGKTGTYSSEAAAANIWITLTTGAIWKVIFTGTFGSKTCTATFECGKDGVESALDSAVITVTAETEP